MRLSVPKMFIIPKLASVPKLLSMPPWLMLSVPPALTWIKPPGWILSVIPDATVRVSPPLITTGIDIAHAETPSQSPPIAIHEGPSDIVPPVANAPGTEINTRAANTGIMRILFVDTKPTNQAINLVYKNDLSFLKVVQKFTMIFRPRKILS